MKERTIGDVLVEMGKERLIPRKYPCFRQYLKNGMCLETEKPSGRMHPCPVEHGEPCLIKEDK